MLKEKDKFIKEKDLRIETIEKQKDLRIETIEKEKDKILEALFNEKSLLKVKECEMVALNQRLLEVDILLKHSRGLLSCRGLFEVYVHSCHSELLMMNLPWLQRSKFATVSINIVLKKIQDNRNEVPESALQTQNLLAIAKRCGVDNLYEIYQSLSIAVHGTPWCEESIRIYSNRMPEHHQCVIRGIAASLKIKTKNVVDVPAKDESADEPSDE